MREASSTDWPRILVLFAAGVAGACLVGKAPAALPLIRDDLGASLFEAGLVVSILALIAGFTGILLGALSYRLGNGRATLLGLALAAVAGLAGAAALDPMQLLVSRFVEGCGYFLAIVSVPPLMLSFSTPRDRQKAMGLWGAFLPAGAGGMLIISGLTLPLIGWRGVWVLTSLLILAAACVLWRSLPQQDQSHEAQAQKRPLADAAEVLAAPGPRLLAAIFATYSAQFLAVTAFVPLILVERAGWSVTAAGIVGALVIAVNIIGNLVVGNLLDRGWSRRSVMTIAALAMALGAAGTYTEGLPVTARIAAAFLFSSVGGMIPGALFAGAAALAPKPRQVSSVNGLLLQGSAIGQVLGPAVVAWVAQSAGGWSGALYFVMPAAALTILFILWLGWLEARR